MAILASVGTVLATVIGLAVIDSTGKNRATQTNNYPAIVASTGAIGDIAAQISAEQSPTQAFSQAASQTSEEDLIDWSYSDYEIELLDLGIESLEGAIHD